MKSAVQRFQVSSPAPEAIRSELAKILASNTFDRCERLGRFLQFLVERTLAGEADQLKEYRIGVEVFRRPPSYDPRLDPVVRLEARRLRAKLQTYYADEGSATSIRIDIPKGAYSAVFSNGTLNGPELVLHARDSGNARSPKYRLSYGFAVAMAGLILLFVVAGAAHYWRSKWTAAPSSPPAIAVLPFLNLTGDATQEYLTDGLTDEITGKLSTIPGLKVVARTSAWQFKGKAQDVRNIGKQLNVSSVLEGSLQWADNRPRITVQLIRASDGYHTWAKTYESDRNGVPAVIGAISDEIAKSLTAAPSRPYHAVDPQAYEFYLRGRYVGQRASSLENSKKSISFFNQAIDRDPLYADAYAYLAGAYAQQAANGWVSPAEAFPAARAAAQRAIELDPNQAWARAILAQIAFYYDWDLPRAEHELRHAIELNPNNASVRQWYGILLTFVRRFQEAAEQLRQARDINPLQTLGIDLRLVMLYEAEGKYDAAIKLDRAILSEHDFTLSHLLLGMLYADKKQYKQALEEVQKAVTQAPGDPDARLGLAIVYVESGQRDKALPIVQQVLASKPPAALAYSIAAAYAALGEREAMYEWLDKSIAARSPACLQLSITSQFDSFRSEPRFQQALKRIGLPL